jgi:hypothetical protein
MNSDRRGFFKKLLGLAAAVVAVPMLPKSKPDVGYVPGKVAYIVDDSGPCPCCGSYSYTTSSASFDTVNIDCVLSDCAITYDRRNS